MNKSTDNFGFYRVAAVSPELRIANPEFNTNEIARIISENKAALYVFPELSISGYSCQDLFFQKKLLKSVEQSLVELCKISKKSGAVIIVGAPLETESRLFNTAVVISGGKIAGVVPKTYLCNHLEYYEERWFASEFDRDTETIMIGNEEVPFGGDLIFENIFDKRFKIGIEICEDMWSPKPPAGDLSVSGATVLVNLSASNEYLGKSDYRLNNVKMHSGRYLAALIYSSSGVWESSAETVFAGKSMIFENASLLAKTDNYSFKSEICIADIDIERLINDRLKNNTFSGTSSDMDFRIVRIEIQANLNQPLMRKISKTPFVPEDESSINKVCSEIIDIQVAGLARRLAHISSKNAVIGISGGLDSTLALIVTYFAFKKLNLDTKGIHAVTMPGFGTTQRTKNNALRLAEKLGLNTLEISINDSVKLHFEEIGHDPEIHDVVYENAQARKRTHILMDLANKYNGIVIGTGDLSETALGWCTYNGDHMSMYGVNSGVPKTLVRYLIEWYARTNGDLEISEILNDISNTPISPELLPPDEAGNIAQETESAIGPYILHDFFLYYAVRHSFQPEKILFLAGIAFDGIYDKKFIKNTLNTFFKRFFGNQFKRNTQPDGPKIGTVALSPRADWRMPPDADSKIWMLD
ncbi:MAG: NAD(+) synthase [Candidatus Kapabacteria bacterium]|nr:NAD(+) synthase [Ignavibacteriota bacterium]MCW5883828.1 NAD(+) synthase [Candidatus Kapabacteria bacterium]